jgi:hypothetical protein
MALAFLGAFVLFTAIMVVAALPVVLLSRRTNPARARRFLTAALVSGLVCGVLATTSEKLVDDCIAAGNPSCLDYGAAGMQLMIVIGYAAIALISGFRLWRD